MPLTKRDERIVVLAPVGQDAAAMAALLREKGFETVICTSLPECCECVRKQVGAVLLTEEALGLPHLAEFQETLQAQPPWSELPLIVLASRGESRLLRLLDLTASAAGSITLLERPMSSATLLRSMEVALRSRRRQYQVRDLLHEQKQKQDELERAKARAEKELAERRLAEEALGKWAHEPLRHQKRSAPLRYGVAALTAAAAVSVRLLLEPVLGGQSPLTALFGAVALAVWYGGFGPALFAALVGYAAIHWWLIQPRHPGGLGLDDLALFVLYLISASLVIAFGLLLRRAQVHAQASARVAVERQRQVEREIEGRRRTEEALRDSEQRYRHLFESIDEGFCVIEVLFDEALAPLDYRFLEINPAFTKHTGMENALGRTMREIIPNQDQHWFEIYGKVARTGEAVRFENYSKPMDRWFNVYAFRIGQPEERKVALLFANITERKRTEESLRQAHELLASRATQLETLVEKRTADLRETVQQLETFSYSIVHDMRAPLRSMRSFADFLQSQYEDKLDDTGRNYLQRIMASAVRMDALINDVLTYSRLSSGETLLGRVDLDKLVTEVVEHYPQFQEAAAAIHIKHPLPMACGNATLLTQVISNLLGNALKFVPDGRMPEVRVRGEIADGKVRLWVEDNGIGIAPEYHEKIFGLFQRLHRPDTYAGTGVGLAIVKKAVERMGGKVGVKSEPGLGSRFWVELDAADAGS